MRVWYDTRMILVEPRTPEHANTIIPIPDADPRLTLRRILVGYDGPDPRYDWLLLADGEGVRFDHQQPRLVEHGHEYLFGPPPTVTAAVCERVAA